jgi:hypothetical protein
MRIVLTPRKLDHKTGCDIGGKVRNLNKDNNTNHTSINSMQVLV